MRKKRLWLKLSVLNASFFAFNAFRAGKAAKIAKELPDPGQFVANRQSANQAKFMTAAAKFCSMKFMMKKKEQLSF